MPRIPSSRPFDAPQCDMRLPEAALRYRRTANPVLTTPQALGAINVTAWLYRDRNGVEGIQVNPNVTIAELARAYGPAATPDAEVGLHSEGTRPVCGDVCTNASALLSRRTVVLLLRQQFVAWKQWGTNKAGWGNSAFCLRCVDVHKIRFGTIKQIRDSVCRPCRLCGLERHS